MYCITYIFMNKEVKYKLPKYSLEEFLQRLDYYKYPVVSIKRIV